MSIKGRLRTGASSLLHRPRTRRLLERTPLGPRLYKGWSRTHPIDRLYGIDTSGFVSVDRLHVDPTLTRHMLPYAGSQPSIIRRAIASLPELDGYSFVDLGCGKGRPLSVASEFPFRRVIGVELSPDLCNVARKNAAAIHRRFPERPPIDIVQGNAARFTAPAGKVVLFFYHSFDAEFIAHLAENLERSLAGSLEHLFVIYYNPVWGEVLDRSPALVRWRADTMRYDPSELGFGPDSEDTVVVWQSLRGAYPQKHAGSDRRILSNPARPRVELALT